MSLAEAQGTASPVYRGEHLSRVAFPLGGIGAGMVCLEGTGALSHVSLRHRPDVFNEPCIFAGLAIKNTKHDAVVARVLEGPVPGWKLFGHPGAGRGDEGTTYGMPRFANVEFSSRFPFGTVALNDPKLPVTARITGWSPFIPGDADTASLPVAALEYTITNVSAAPISAVFSFNARNFMGGAIRSAPSGFIFSEKDNTGAKVEGFQVDTDDPSVNVNHAWFRGDWWDPMTMAWRDVATAAAFDRPPVEDGGPEATGASLFVPFDLAAHASKTVVVRLSWFIGHSNLRIGDDPPGTTDTSTYAPWYSGKFADLRAVASYWGTNYRSLRERTTQFTNAFYDTTLPPTVVEAVAANLSILKSPTTMRQVDGKLWLWEGCNDTKGSCAGSCTHVWNYAQAIAHLFPSLERTLRETEFGPSQDEHGHQMFRSALPIRPQVHDDLPAADGQLGGIMKMYRDWRISGDTEWLRGIWPAVQRSLDYCIATWDPNHSGWLEAPHHNTYDIEFSGGDGMCTSFYLGALRAATLMGTALNADVSRYAQLYDKGVARTERELYNGEYFIQHIAPNPNEKGSPEERALEAKEGPKYQYGTGCLSDGVIGSWMALACSVGQVLDVHKVKSHVTAVHRYNLKHDLSEHANTQRPAYAANDEGGLLLCTWPHGNKPSLPFVYSDEVWTGIEYQVASHLMLLGDSAKGLDIVRACRARYDGRVRNPYNEYECGHWYGRALASYAMLQGLSGARYDAVSRTLYLHPSVAGDFRAFLATQTGFGTVGVRNGRPFVSVIAGTIDVQHTEYTPARG